MGALYSKVVWGAEDSPELEVPITLSADATMPDYATTGAAGLDLHAAERVELEIGKPALVETGVSIALPFMLYGQIQGRSGLAYKESLYVHPGVVDCDFRGTIKVMVVHNKPVLTFADRDEYPDGPPPAFKEPPAKRPPSYVIEKGDRIAQLLVLPVARPGLRIVDALPATTRGEGGFFGSTGVRVTVPDEGPAIDPDADKENQPAGPEAAAPAAGERV